MFPILALSILSFLAHIPATAFNAIRVATDGAEYVTMKVAQGTQKLDYYADEVETILHDAGQTPEQQANEQAKLQKRIAKRAAKAKPITRTNN